MTSEIHYVLEYVRRSTKENRKKTFDDISKPTLNFLQMLLSLCKI
jgi:hypothetical protein